MEGVEPERLVRVSRRKIFGKQFLTYIISGRDSPDGIELIPSYSKVKINGKIIEDKTQIVSTKPRYTIPFTKTKAEELVKRCIEESETPEFTFKYGGKTISIRNPENFTGDFDEMVKRAAKGESV